jgi:hypothetical protein
LEPLLAQHATVEDLLDEDGHGEPPATAADGHADGGEQADLELRGGRQAAAQHGEGAVELRGRGEQLVVRRGGRRRSHGTTSCSYARTSAAYPGEPASSASWVPIAATVPPSR